MEQVEALLVALKKLSLNAAAELDPINWYAEEGAIDLWRGIMQL